MTHCALHLHLPKVIKNTAKWTRGQAGAKLCSPFIIEDRRHCTVHLASEDQRLKIGKSYQTPPLFFYNHAVINPHKYQVCKNMVVTRTALVTAPNIAILIIMIRIIVIFIVIIIIMIITVRSAMRHQLVHDGHFSLSPLSALVTPRPALSSFGLPLQSSSLRSSCHHLYCDRSSNHNHVDSAQKNWRNGGYPLPSLCGKYIWQK